MAGGKIKGVRCSNAIGCPGRKRIGSLPLLVTWIIMVSNVVGERDAGCGCSGESDRGEIVQYTLEEGLSCSPHGTVCVVQG